MCDECGMHAEKMKKPVIAVCGKGGVGKTVFSALLAKSLRAENINPLLLVDADPVGGLTSAIGETAVQSLAGVREHFIAAVRKGGKDAAAELAPQLENFVFRALLEREGFALLAMGHNTGKGCFCPANKLLKNAIDVLIPGFAGVLIDAEAGIEQINREVTGRVTQVIAVVDGSRRSMDTLGMIVEKFGDRDVAAVVNRTATDSGLIFPGGIRPLGCIPENEELLRFDREGKSLWLLPEDNAAVAAARAISRKVSFT